MITLRPAASRGATRIDWLDSKHSFSFGEYRDAAHMGLGPLRVINEDKVSAGQGFGTHPHRDMEIITYVLEGALQHQDSLGTGSIIVPGDVQRMSAGTGIAHSEFNPRADAPAHFLQIWIIPQRAGLAPSYEQKNFTERRAPGRLTLLASPDGREDSLTVHQDATLSVLDITARKGFRHTLSPARQIWLQVARGEASLGALRLAQGDGVAIADEAALDITTQSAAEILLFNLPE